jgi:oxygen-independent coproporphyrinogen-3 oxidase
MSGIYVHVPFCRRACSYCDFYFSTTQTLLPDFIAALKREILASPPEWRTEPVRTVYFGGGTPSMLPDGTLRELLETIATVFSVESGAEITLEANPEDISVLRCRNWLNAGITRLSLGIQTFDADTLKWMNRPHSPEQARQCIKTVAQAGFASFSCDLIYALPSQQDNALLTDLSNLLVFQPPHISAYTLTVEEGTRLHAWVQKGHLLPADDDAAARHMQLVSETLQKQGYERYEVSNFCLPGFHSRHNSAYWTHENYFGFGPGAHSFFKTGAQHAIRWNNPAHLNRYVKCAAFERFRVSEQVGAAGLAEERIYLGLRTKRGLDFRELEPYEPGISATGFFDTVKRLTAAGLLSQNGTHLAVTEKGYPVSDRIALEIITELGL